MRPSGEQQAPVIPGPEGGRGVECPVRWQHAARRLWQAVQLRIGAQRVVHVRYPDVFRLLVGLTFVAFILWVVNFFLAVLPRAAERGEGPCKYNDDQLMMNAKLIFLYIFWCFGVRMIACVPGISAHIAQVRVETHGTLRVCLAHMFFYGPFYFFTIAALLYLLQLTDHPSCAEQRPDLFMVLKLYASYSLALGFMCLVLLFWQHRLINAAIRESEKDQRGAPPDTIDKLVTRQFDTSVFSDDGSTPYPGECPICLLSWGPDECIKIPPCGHAFHKDYLRNWLHAQRTCALCRHDVTLPTMGPAATPAGPAKGSAFSASPIVDVEAPAEGQGAEARDTSVFSDDGSTLCPGECPICLLSWGPDDCIKITPCGHAFHKDCLGNWLQAQRTCALCRHDVTLPTMGPAATPARPAKGSASSASPIVDVEAPAAHLGAWPEGADARDPAGGDSDVGGEFEGGHAGPSDRATSWRVAALGLAGRDPGGEADPRLIGQQTLAGMALVLSLVPFFLSLLLCWVLWATP